MSHKPHKRKKYEKIIIKKTHKRENPLAIPIVSERDLFIDLSTQTRMDTEQNE